NFNGQHAVHPRTVGRVHFANPVGPGWANPETGSFEDPRLVGRDGKRYGPLPRTWAHYRGLYHYGNQIILSYTVGHASVLEMPAYELLSEGKESDETIAFTRTLSVGRSDQDLLLQVAPAGTSVAMVGASNVILAEKNGFL